MKEIQMLCTALLTGLSLLYAYLIVYMVIGFFTTKRFPKARQNHKIAVLIAARNEASVIGNLLASIRSQSYPRSCITVFVAADNCTDRTADIARQNGAVCYERFDTEHQTKGFALQFLFRQIRRDYGIESFDGYLILDADNVLKPDYIEKMNDAFDSGEKIITSYRNTNNLDKGCIAASYAIHWMRTIRLEHRARSVLGLASRLQGTGILFANELVKDGWNYTLLAEDRSFCADAVLRGYSISYQDEAEFFDEQPVSLSVAMRQRIRWSKGHLQAFSCCGMGLFKHIFTTRGMKRRFMSYDMFLITLPQALLHVILTALNLSAAAFSWLLLSGNSLPPAQIKTALLALGGAALFTWARQTAMAAYILFIERRRLKRLSFRQKVWYCSTFFLFDLIGTIAVCAAAVTKVEWKPIPHYGTQESEQEMQTQQAPFRAA